MVNNSTNIIKMINHLSPQIMEHKKYHKYFTIKQEKTGCC
jgi:hypothetical protein